MAKENLIRIAIVQNIEYEKCRELVEALKKQHVDAILVCGGIGQCLSVLEVNKKLFGITNIDDDTHVVKALKNREAFVAGSWQLIEKNVCIGGVDAKNPVQNVERLERTILSQCSFAIIISYYPLKKSICAKAEFMGRSLSFGLKSIFKNKSKQIKYLVIACNKNFVHSFCKQTLDSEGLLVTTNESFISLLVDLQNLDVAIVK
ncbi:hypothetical protein QPL79_01440 [Ignisphaera sp. 4213-co]|uniref:Uncharacterized protein n=1 Tax=Ignisphaera cupida TaxID=3050454 RepID=A0ABD4Z4H8_9CREN|nr:hypothetical protein [Ignisphaera sp. 4213-co]MDK6028029.1 hypothetical protein [Ignisphaera sp. 4213-co]